MVELGDADSFELQVKLPGGGATGQEPWHGWLGEAYVEAPVVLGPWLRSSLRCGACRCGG